jgi:hypothetical protein
MLGGGHSLMHAPVLGLQEASAGQQMGGWPLGCAQTCVDLQQLPSVNAVVPSGQQTGKLRPVTTCGFQGQHMRRLMGGDVAVAGLTTKAQSSVQQTRWVRLARGLYSRQILACGHRRLRVQQQQDKTR